MEDSFLWRVESEGISKGVQEGVWKTPFLIDGIKTDSARAGD